MYYFFRVRRGISSVPSQLGLKKFSYCLVSHKFDDTPKSSFLLMDPESDSDKKTQNLSYTKLLKNPVSHTNIALSDYYYVGLRKITVGGKEVEVSYEQPSPDSNGNGGTIVDSGSTFTYKSRPIFNAVANPLCEQVKEYKQAKKVESLTSLRPCFFAVDDDQKLVVCLCYESKQDRKNGSGEYQKIGEGKMFYSLSEALKKMIKKEKKGRVIRTPLPENASLRRKRVQIKEEAEWGF